jgi:hypothetical protein
MAVAHDVVVSTMAIFTLDLEEMIRGRADTLADW